MDDINYITHTHTQYIHIYQPLRSDRIWHKVNFKRSLTSLKSEFSSSQTSCLTKAEKPSLPYYLPIAGGRIIGFIRLPRVLVLCEMQLAWSRIWTRVAVSISYDDNHYTTGTSHSVSPIKKNTPIIFFLIKKSIFFKIKDMGILFFLVEH